MSSNELLFTFRDGSGDIVSATVVVTFVFFISETTSHCYLSVRRFSRRPWLAGEKARLRGELAWTRKRQSFSTASTGGYRGTCDSKSGLGELAKHLEPGAIMTRNRGKRDNQSVSFIPFFLKVIMENTATVPLSYIVSTAGSFAMKLVRFLGGYQEPPNEMERKRQAAAIIVFYQLSLRYPSLLIDNEGPPKKRRFVRYDRARARECVWADYISPTRYFNDKQFVRMLRVTPTIFETLRAAARKHPFFRPGNKTDAVGREAIDINVKLVMALKQIGYGCAGTAFTDYCQMGESTARDCLTFFIEVLYNSNELVDVFLRDMTRADARRVVEMHRQEHGVDGMLGSLDCMHVRWKNCPVAWQGTYNGKEDGPTIVLEAACDYSLWVWWSSFGYPGTCNDINIWDASPLHRSMVDGTMDRIDFDYFIAGLRFNKLWFTVDGIYPELERFVKTISVPIGRKEKNFSGWQEATRKSIERCFGVLQRKFRILLSPVEIIDPEKIRKLVMVVIMLHNMMVQERLDKGIDEDDFANDEDCFQEWNENNPTPSAEQEVGILEAEVRRRLQIIRLYQRNDIPFVDAAALHAHERIRRLPQSMRVVQARWDSLHSRDKHRRLKKAIVNELNGAI